MQHKGRVLAVTISVAVGFAVVPGSVVADDQYPTTCRDTTPITEPGAHSGTLSPDDSDALLIKIPQGDYITTQIEFTSPTDSVRLDISASDETFTDPDGSALTKARSDNPVIQLNRGEHSFLRIRPGRVTFRIYNEDENPMCLKLGTYESNTGDWKLSFSRGDAKPPSLSENAGGHSEEELSSLRQTITEQQQRITELEAQLAAERNASQDVTIDVTVQPGEEQQAFVDGGTAVVTAESQQADLSQLTAEYRGDTYQVIDGSVRLPLQGTGEQAVTLRYGDTAETVRFAVQATATPTTASADASTDTPPPTATTGTASGDTAETDATAQPEDTPPATATEDSTGVVGPGFGLGSALAALLCLTALLVLRRS